MAITLFPHTHTHTHAKTHIHMNTFTFVTHKYADLNKKSRVLI